MVQFIIHYGLHLGLPLILSLILYKQYWLKAYLIMLCAFLIDLDHLLANPIFDPNRCSIGYHPLHSFYAIIVYLILVFPKPTRIIAIGLLAHIASDLSDCLLM